MRSLTCKFWILIVKNPIDRFQFQNLIFYAWSVIILRKNISLSSNKSNQYEWSEICCHPSKYPKSTTTHISIPWVLNHVCAFSTSINHQSSIFESPGIILLLSKKNKKQEDDINPKKWLKTTYKSCDNVKPPSEQDHHHRKCSIFVSSCMIHSLNLGKFRPGTYFQDWVHTRLTWTRRRKIFSNDFTSQPI